MFEQDDGVGGAQGRARGEMGTVRNELTRQTEAWMERQERGDPIVVELRKQATRGDGVRTDRACVATWRVPEARWLLAEGPHGEELEATDAESAADLLRIVQLRIESGYLLASEFTHEGQPKPPWEVDGWPDRWRAVREDVVKQPSLTHEQLVAWMQQTGAKRVADLADIWFGDDPPMEALVYQHERNGAPVYTMIGYWHRASGEIERRGIEL